MAMRCVLFIQSILLMLCVADMHNEDIYVGIVNFRDRRCGVTLNNLFSKAKYPDRVSIGVIEYTHTEDDTSDCIKDFCRIMGHSCEKLKKNIKIVIVSFLDARGPGFARYMQESLLGDQDFCLQIDTHSDFIQDWDTDLVQTWRALNNEYGVISTQPPPLDRLHAKDSKTEVDHLCQATVTKTGMIRNLKPQKQSISAISEPSSEGSHRILSPLWSAAFSFSKCHAVKKVPYDPALLYLFDGEEYAMFARLWTRGYDVYTPSHTVVVHDYGTALFGKLPEHEGAMMSAGKKIDFIAWARQGQSPEYMRQMYDDAHGHVTTMLGSVSGEAAGSHSSSVTASELSLLSKYGLGTKRSLDQLIEFTGIDTRNGKLVADKCGKALSFVPFERDADPWLEEGDVWGRAPEEIQGGGIDIPLIDGGSTLNLIS